MIRFLCIGWLMVVVVLPVKSRAQAAADTMLDLANWNIEWLGSRQNGPGNEALQQQNAGVVLNYLKADLYGLCEIVDTAVLGALVRNIPGNYGYVVSDFCSLAGNPIDADWAAGQKLAFVYNRNVFSNVKTRGLLRASGAAYSNWASGRYPFLFTANVKINNRSRAFHAVLIHAKSGATNNDWNRRNAGAQELKDTIDQYFGNTSLALFGDFNDDLDVSIVPSLPSSFQFWVADSTDAVSYKSITLPLSLQGRKSTISFNEVIDHQMVNKSLAAQYLPGSARIRTDVTTVVPTYNSRNTSDHYPVTTQFVISSGDTLSTIVNPVPAPSAAALPFQLLGNPAVQGEILFRSAENIARTTITLVNADGRVVWQKTQSLSVGPNSLFLFHRTRGMHWLRIEANGQIHILPVLLW